jgi:hypothetical protein
LQTTQTGGENADEIITLYKPAQPQWGLILDVYTVLAQSQKLNLPNGP